MCSQCPVRHLLQFELFSYLLSARIFNENLLLLRDTKTSMIKFSLPRVMAFNYLIRSFHLMPLPAPRHTHTPQTPRDRSGPVILKKGDFAPEVELLDSASKNIGW